MVTQIDMLCEGNIVKTKKIYLIIANIIYN
jgi:hypothetical protein